MGGVKAEFDKSHWESLPELKRVEMLKEWVLIEVDHRRVRGVVLSKQTIEKLDPKTKEELLKRNIKVFILGDKTIGDQDLYEAPVEKKKVSSATVIPPQEMATRLKKELREIRKEDYDSLNPVQKAANPSFTLFLYLFKGTEEFIPESKKIIDAYLAEVHRQEAAMARRRETPPLNQVLASVLGKKVGKGAA